MAQHSNSSGSGNLLVRAFMGILSITATAVVSTMVQRYFATPASWAPASAPSAVQPSLNAEPSAPALPSNSPLLETNQPETNLPETNLPQATQSEVNQPDRSAEVRRSDSSPIQVETQPVPDSSSLSPVEPAGNSSEPSASEPSSGATLRDKLDSALRDKWNKQ